MPRKIISCSACNTRFDVGKYPPGSRVRCGRCSQVLTVPMDPAPTRRKPGGGPGGTRSRAAGMSQSGQSSALDPSVGRRRSQPVRRAQDMPPPRKDKGAIAPRRTTPVGTAGGTAQARRDPLLGKSIQGTYEIIRKLGEGGYGAVYEARDVNLQRKVAVKVMLPSRAQSREYVSKFLREARTAAQLSHPNVVAVHGVGFDRETKVHFLAMEFVEGRTVHDVLHERGPLPFEEATEYLLQSCRGLAAAHERNIIHRDIKPGNLMITPSGAIKIADFGLAKVYDPTAEQSTVIGTPYFMPPEQFEGKAKDGRTDIYALGVTYYYMLTMKRPHTGSGPAQILLSVMNNEPKPVHDHNPDLPEGLWPIIRKMIHRDLDTRYNDCKKIIHDLESLRGGGEEEVEQIYCPGCGVPNPMEATECSGCKESLLETCPKCGAEDMAGTKFCGDCGANIPLERAVSALIGEARDLAEKGKVDEAVEKVNQARDRSPDNLEAAQLCQELQTRKSELSGELAAVRDLLAQGKPEEARLRLDSAAEDFSKSQRIVDLEGDIKSALAAHQTTSPGSEAIANARRLENDGRYREALVAWRGVLVLSPDDADAKEGEARVAERVESAESKFAEGTSRLSAGDPEGGLERLEAANEILPGDALIEGRLNEARRQAGDVRSEIERLAPLLETDPASVAAQLRTLVQRFPGSSTIGDMYATAESAGREASREAARERIVALVSAAKDHEDGKRLREALSAYKQASSLDPDNRDVGDGLARVQRFLAEYEAHVNQSRNLLQAGDPGGALEKASKALELIPGDPAAEAQVARAKSAGDRLRHEAERIRTAIQDDPEDEVLKWAQELASQFSGSGLAQDVLVEAEEACRAAEEEEKKGKLDKMLERARRYEEENNLQRALAAYDECLRVDPDHADSKAAHERTKHRLDRSAALAEEAQTLLDAGNPDAAVKAAEESLELYPDQASPAGTLAGARSAMTEIERTGASLHDALGLEQAQAQVERVERLREKFPESVLVGELVERTKKTVADAEARDAEAALEASVDAAKSALTSGDLTGAIEKAKAILAAHPDHGDASEIVSQAEQRRKEAADLVARARKALGDKQTEDAVEMFEAALAVDPKVEGAQEGLDEANATLRAARERLGEAVSKAETAVSEHRLRDGITAWEKVKQLDPSNTQAEREILALQRKLAEAQENARKGQECLANGNPDDALRPLENAAAALGGDELQTAFETARAQVKELDTALPEIEMKLDTVAGELDEIADRAASLAERFPGATRAQRISERARQKAADRKSALALVRVKSLLKEGQYGAAGKLATELLEGGLDSPELRSAQDEAQKALAKVDGLRERYGASRQAGDLDDALAAAKELVAITPDDMELKGEVGQLEESVREVQARTDLAETARGRGNLEESLRLYREIAELRGVDPSSIAEYIALEAATTSRDDAVEACEEALLAGDGETCAAKADALLQTHPDDEELLDLRTAGESMATMVRSLMTRAQRAIDKGDHKAANRALDTLLRSAPNHEKAREMRAAAE